jgi:acyl carrier protein
MHMSKHDLLAVISGLVADALDQPIAKVTPTASLVTDLGAESLDFIDLTFRIESTFGIKIAENDLWQQVESPQQVTPTTIVTYLVARGVTGPVEGARD